jgi:PAS domain S-box-containing protein
MIVINILPFIPMSIKGILGIAFIIISCIKIGLKDGLITATLWIVFGYINFFLGINVDYKQGMLTMLLGSAAYYLTAYYFGTFADTLKNKNRELSDEIEIRKNVEKELKKKLTLLQSLMDTAPSPIFFKDLSYRYIGCNRAYETIMGIKNNELIGKTVYDILDKDLADVHQKKDVELLVHLEKQIYEEVVKFPDGNLRNIIFNKVVFTDENGAPMGIVGVMTDVTDKKEAGELKENIHQMLEADKMKTEFFSNISHELRTPLNVILGSVQLVELYLSKDQYNDSMEKVIRNIATMKQNCFRLLRIVNNLIDISKIDAKAFELHLKNCNIVNVVKEITLSVSDYIENRGIRLIFTTDIEEKTMACDDEKIERIILNLLSNAIKFTPIGGEIIVHICNMDNGICIKVQDNGIGIPENKQNLIFQRFCQVDEMFTRQHEGSGIGLNLVKSLVEMHGGTITFESKVGIGTHFIINLPYKKVEEREVQYNTFGKQAHIERISVEFSDIYSIGI